MLTIDLARASLVRANLADANLADANLADANLADANLAGANLVGANLADANLADANLAGANLVGANLAGANLVGANLAGAKGIVCAGYCPRGHRFVGVEHADGPRVAANGWWFTIAEAKTHWADNNRHSSPFLRDALARVALIETLLEVDNAH